MIVYSTYKMTFCGINNALFDVSLPAGGKFLDNLIRLGLSNVTNGEN